MRIKWWPYRFTTAALVLLVACGSPNPNKEQSSPSAPKSQYPTGTLDQLLAPIALYPDPLLAQILMSAGDPSKVTELHKWLQSNQKLKGTALQDAAVKAGFDPSFVALTLFPQVVAKMAEQIAWTTLLGQSFTSDRNAVFASIQKLRQQATNVGTLKSTPQQDVKTRKTETGQEVIVIEPANPQIVYVPQYNTQVVYTQAPSNPAPAPAPAPSNTTVIVEDDDDDAEMAIAAGLIGFTAGVVIGASMNNSYYYGPYGWHGGGYMYAEAWDDYYDHREDAREDWMDHREDLVEERSDRLEDRSEQRTDRSEQRTDRRESTQGQRTERQQTRQENRPDTQAQRTQRSTQAQSASAQTASAQTASSRSATAQTERANRTGSPEARGYGDGSRSQSATPRSSGSSDAFSGYSSGASQRSASTRGQQSRSSSSARSGSRSSGSRSSGGRRR